MITHRFIVHQKLRYAGKGFVFACAVGDQEQNWVIVLPGESLEAPFFELTFELLI